MKLFHTVVAWAEPSALLGNFSDGAIPSIFLTLERDVS